MIPPAIPVALAVGSGLLIALWPASPWPWRLVGASTTSRGDPEDASPATIPAVRAPGRPRRHSARRGQHRSDPGPAIELLGVALSAGLGLHQAILAAADALGGGSPLREPAGALRRGEQMTDALDRLAHDQPGWSALATALAVTATSGAPALPTLRQLGTAERLSRRRGVEARVRRLPVLLLVPLVGLVLPAFALVSFVPLLVALAGSLH